MNLNKLLVGLLLCSVPMSATAEDQSTENVVRLTLPQAEQRFLEQNLLLLATKYGIDAAEGLRIQASVWQNPTLQIGQGLYDSKSEKFFDTSSSGNTDFQIAQLIYLAGKHDKQIKIAEHGEKIAERQFEDVSRNLRFQLRKTFYRLFLRKQTLRYFEAGLSGLTKTMRSAENAFQNRSILLSEVLRVKSLVTALQSDRVDALSDASDAESDLKTLLAYRDSPHLKIEPVVDEEELERLIIPNSYDELLKQSLVHRPDLKIFEEQTKQEEVNLSLQKAMRFPDITIGYQYSKQGSYIRDYNAITLGISLPIFDTNEGNIKSSQAQLSSKQALQRQALLNHEHDLYATYQKAIDISSAFKTFDTKFVADYQGLVQKMTFNYERRNVSIIVFADFYEAFRSSVLQLSSMQLKRISAFEDLNFHVGEQVVKLRERVNP